MAKAQADAPEREAGEAAQRKVAEKRAKTEAKISYLEAEKAQFQSICEEETTCAREELERRAAEATATAMKEAEQKMKRQIAPGGFFVDILRSLFKGDSGCWMKIAPGAEDSASSEDSSQTPCRRRQGKQRTPKRARRPAERHPDKSNPFLNLQRRRCMRLPTSPRAHLL